MDQILFRLSLYYLNILRRRYIRWNCINQPIPPLLSRRWILNISMFWCWAQSFLYYIMYVHRRYDITTYVCMYIVYLSLGGVALDVSYILWSLVPITYDAVIWIRCLEESHSIHIHTRKTTCSTEWEYSPTICHQTCFHLILSMSTSSLCLSICICIYCIHNM